MSKYCLKVFKNSNSSQTLNASVLALNCTKINILALAILVTMIAVYLWQANILATSGYKIDKLQSSVKDLQQQNQQLNVEYTNLQSMQNLEAKIKELQLVAVAQTDYLNSLETVMAVK